MDSPIKYAKSGGVRIAYRIFGEGSRDIVLVPRTASHLELMWEVPAGEYMLNETLCHPLLLASTKVLQPASGLFHCSVSEGPEIGKHSRRFGRIHHALREEDADHFLGGIGVGRGAEAPVPAEAARVVKGFVPQNVHCHPQAPARMSTEKDFAIRALPRRQMIRCHQLHGGARQNLLAAVASLVQHHARERKVVVDGRDEPATC